MSTAASVWAAVRAYAQTLWVRSEDSLAQDNILPDGLAAMQPLKALLDSDAELVAGHWNTDHVEAVTAAADSLPRRAFSSGVAGASTRV